MIFHYIAVVIYLAFLYTVFITEDIKGIVVMGIFTILVTLVELWIAFEKWLEQKNK